MLKTIIHTLSFKKIRNKTNTFYTVINYFGKCEVFELCIKGEGSNPGNLCARKKEGEIVIVLKDF